MTFHILPTATCFLLLVKRELRFVVLVILYSHAKMSDIFSDHNPHGLILMDILMSRVSAKTVYIN